MQQLFVSFLWRFPWGRPRRTLSGAVSPWSPDFPPLESDGRPRSVTLLAGLTLVVHSGTLSHYCLPRGLLVAGFHPSPGSSLLSQPEYLGLLHGTHIDDKLSADVPSTWPGQYTEPPASNQSTIQPPSSRITEDANWVRTYIHDGSEIRKSGFLAESFRPCEHSGSLGIRSR